MLRLSETRDTLSVVDDQIGGPTPAADIAAALLNIARRMTENRDGTIGGTYHFAGQPSVSWKEFAETIFDLAGREVTVHGIPTVKYPTPARRPLNSRLDCSKLTQDLDIDPPDWRRGLQKVLDELGASV
jgi:dTDP-4-dehydrorhamnose reductase